MLDKEDPYTKVPKAIVDDLRARNFLEGLRRPGSTVNVLFDDIPIEVRSVMSNCQRILIRDLITKEAAKRTNFHSEALDQYLDDKLVDDINKTKQDEPGNYSDKWLASQSDLVQELFNKSAKSPVLIRHFRHY